MKFRVILLLGLCAGCKSDAASTSSSVAASASTTAANVQSAPSAASTSALRPGETLMGAIVREGQNRPTAKPNADDVFAAMVKAGVAVGERKQSLGSTYKAAYCTGGYTTDGALALSVCEYASEAEATAGRDFAATLFPNLTTRSVRAHKTNTLTVIEQKTDADAKAAEKKAFDAFNAT